MPLIGVLTPFVVHVDVQSATLYPGFSYVHVVLLSNATHFVTAWAPVVVMAHSIAPAINIFDFIVLLLFFLNKKTTKNFGGQEVKNN